MKGKPFFFLDNRSPFPLIARSEKSAYQDRAQTTMGRSSRQWELDILLQ